MRECPIPGQSCLLQRLPCWPHDSLFWRFWQHDFRMNAIVCAVCHSRLVQSFRLVNCLLGVYVLFLVLLLHSLDSTNIR